MSATIAQREAWGFDSDGEEAWLSEMEWAVPQYSKQRVNGAGRALVSPYSTEDELDEAVAIINNWRSSHSFPLNIFQNGLRQRGGQVDENCVVAQRLKRLPAIEHKLNRFPTMTLSQMQDIGGCRAIVDSLDHVTALHRMYVESRIKHEHVRVDDYIAQPRHSGYRSLHLIYRYFSDKKITYNTLLIEIQLRSQLQHSWATAVETVDTYTEQSLKTSGGEGDWERFFVLMGTSFAIQEKSPGVPETPDLIEDVVDELRAVASRIGVITKLRAYQSATKIFEERLGGAHFFLLDLDARNRQIGVKGYTFKEADEALDAYAAAEKRIGRDPTSEAVLVSVNSVAELKRAYPNYFLDTNVFIEHLRDMLYRPRLRRRLRTWLGRTFDDHHGSR